MNDQQGISEWREGRVPVSARFDDPYFSLEDGLAETRHVFLAGNNLPERFADGFTIAVLGFGTGLNFLTAWAAWEAAGQPGAFRFVSFEAFPLAAGDMAQALAAFPAVEVLAARMIDAMVQGPGPYDFGSAVLDLRIGDARETLPKWQGAADAWFLDGFAPAKNPELWEPELMQSVHDHTAPGGTAATYTAAGDVRRALSAAGFEVTRVPGFGRKRHMTTAVRSA